jgi:hypothetical protein
MVGHKHQHGEPDETAQQLRAVGQLLGKLTSITDRLEQVADDLAIALDGDADDSERQDQSKD